MFTRILLVAVAFAGAAAGASAQTVWRGNFVAGKAGLQMSPCRSGERLAVEDLTPQRELASVYRELAQRPGRAIFVEFSGKRESKTLFADRLIRAYADGPGCREDLDRVQLRALGTQPLWYLDARADAVLLRRPGGGAPHRFPAGAFERRGAEYVYEGAAEKSVLRVVLREERCHDPLSGALYTLRALADWDGRKFPGCAYWGGLAPEQR